MNKINIMDTTLRDGSYAVNFSFTSQDTAIICKELESAGFDLIEIGHGVGLNAGNKGYGKASATDEAYMKAAAKALKRAKYGMFCIPGIALPEDIDVAADNGMGFIRIGTNASEAKMSKEFIRKAKKHRMFVAANFMKSYSLSAKKFAENAAISEGYGADMVYIVDSAGGMFPDDIKRYYDAIRKVTDLPIGFHGHDNLGMAVANSLEAADMGIELIDASLQGLGRSSGNAPTEVLVAALLKMNYKVNIDFFKILEIGLKYVQPMIRHKGRMPLDVVAGYAEFHSSYMHHIKKFTAKYGINPVALMIEWSKIDKMNVNEDAMEGIARKMRKRCGEYSGKYDFRPYFGSEQDERKR